MRRFKGEAIVDRVGFAASCSVAVYTKKRVPRTLPLLVLYLSPKLCRLAGKPLRHPQYYSAPRSKFDTTESYGQSRHPQRVVCLVAMRQ